LTIHESGARQLIIAEPSATFRVSPPLTIDCSVLGALLFDEPQADEAHMRIVGCELHAPVLLDFEFANLAARKAAKGLADRAIAALEAYTLLGHMLHPVDTVGMFELARRYSISACDAAYLWLAAKLGTPLATFDVRLGKAAIRHLGAIG